MRVARERRLLRSTAAFPQAALLPRYVNRSTAMNRMSLSSDAIRHPVPAGTGPAAPCGPRVGGRAVCPLLGAAALAFAIATPWQHWARGLRRDFGRHEDSPAPAMLFASPIAVMFCRPAASVTLQTNDATRSLARERASRLTRSSHLDWALPPCKHPSICRGACRQRPSATGPRRRDTSGIGAPR